MCKGSENSLFEMTKRFAVKHKDPHKALCSPSPEPTYSEPSKLCITFRRYLS